MYTKTLAVTPKFFKTPEAMNKFKEVFEIKSDENQTYYTFDPSKTIKPPHIPVFSVYMYNEETNKMVSNISGFLGLTALVLAYAENKDSTLEDFYKIVENSVKKPRETLLYIDDAFMSQMHVISLYKQLLDKEDKRFVDVRTFSKHNFIATFYSGGEVDGFNVFLSGAHDEIAETVKFFKEGNILDESLTVKELLDVFMSEEFESPQHPFEHAINALISARNMVEDNVRYFSKASFNGEVYGLQSNYDVLVKVFKYNYWDGHYYEITVDDLEFSNGGNFLEMIFKELIKDTENFSSENEVATLCTTKDSFGEDDWDISFSYHWDGEEFVMD